MDVEAGHLDFLEGSVAVLVAVEDGEGLRDGEEEACKYCSGDGEEVTRKEEEGRKKGR